jgi:hypothetical protein
MRTPAPFVGLAQGLVLLLLVLPLVRGRRAQEPLEGSGTVHTAPPAVRVNPKWRMHIVRIFYDFSSQHSSSSNAAIDPETPGQSRLQDRAALSATAEQRDTDLQR